jgi:SAM-dependent methyltransferase
VFFYDISEADHRIMNPLSPEKLALIGELCRLSSDDRVIDLGCGKGELLCTWAARHASAGVGVDGHAPFVRAAEARAEQLGVGGLVRFECKDARGHTTEEHFTVAACIGATWIGGGTQGTVELLRKLVRGVDSLLLVGDVFFRRLPPAGVDDLLGSREEVGTLAETVERLEAGGAEVIEMVLASEDEWDRYQATQWRNITEWLATNTAHPQAPEFRDTHELWKRAYLDYGRQRWGWGVFVLRLKAQEGGTTKMQNGWPAGSA